MEVVYRKDLSRLYFIRRLKSFKVCNKMLLTFYQSILASIIFFGVVCLGTGNNTKDASRPNKMLRKVESVVSSWLVNLEEVLEQRMPTKLLGVMDNTSHPVHETEHSEE